MGTVRNLFNNAINSEEVDIITVHCGSEIIQADSVESETLDKVLDHEVVDYEVQYDADEGIVYLDIYCN
jgi:hypothetical protein